MDRDNRERAIYAIVLNTPEGMIIYFAIYYVAGVVFVATVLSTVYKESTGVE